MPSSTVGVHSPSYSAHAASALSGSNPLFGGRRKDRQGFTPLDKQGDSVTLRAQQPKAPITNQPLRVQKNPLCKDIKDVFKQIPGSTSQDQTRRYQQVMAIINKPEADASVFGTVANYAGGAEDWDLVRAAINHSKADSSAVNFAVMTSNQAGKTSLTREFSRHPKANANTVFWAIMQQGPNWPEIETHYLNHPQANAKAFGAAAIFAASEKNWSFAKNILKTKPLNRPELQRIAEMALKAVKLDIWTLAQAKLRKLPRI